VQTERGRYSPPFDRVDLGLFPRGLRGTDYSAPGSLRSSGAGAPCDAHSPVAFAMISLATLAGTSA
jgi:hypothetical protein